MAMRLYARQAKNHDLEARRRRCDGAVGKAAELEWPRRAQGTARAKNENGAAEAAPDALSGRLTRGARAAPHRAALSRVVIVDQ
jgi:hypothetical protein